MSVLSLRSECSVPGGGFSTFALRLERDVVSSPFFIGGFFVPQQILQLAWLRELWRQDDEVEGTSLTLVPYYALGGGAAALFSREGPSLGI
jgi:hypothetical protein